MRIHAAASRAKAAGDPAPSGPQASQATARCAPATTSKLDGGSHKKWLLLDQPYRTCPAPGLTD